nr:MAG TPA: hypothetical protein [Caudoviricetes sp.]
MSKAHQSTCKGWQGIAFDVLQSYQNNLIKP